MTKEDVFNLVSGGGTLTFALVVWMELRGLRQELHDVLLRLLGEKDGKAG